MSLFLGLMSGTSLDGIDGVAVAWHDDDASVLKVLAHVHQPFDAALRSELMALIELSHDALERGARASIALARACAGVVRAVLEQAGVAVQVRAIGAHGQTVRHRPDSGLG